MSANAVKFEFKNGHVGAVNLEVAKKLEEKKEGKILKGEPAPPKTRNVTEDEKK